MKLYQARKGDALVYVNPKTGKGFVCVRKAFHSVNRRAEIKNLTLHDLRRTFATRLLNAGAAIITVQQLLGHTSVKTTQLYTMTNQEEKRRAVLLLDGPSRANLARIWPTNLKEGLPYPPQNCLFSMN
ncbi:MAG: tyrosine-type recombinase/integrase [Candidatus Aminicenantes bacterium]|nr:MAG: tyrosine-type recombinase/integrase [Candidatus Aminicenantes bacterium]